jgi:hypothetical protein
MLALPWSYFYVRMMKLTPELRKLRCGIVIASHRAGANGSRECAPDDRLRAAR